MKLQLQLLQCSWPGVAHTSEVLRGAAALAASCFAVLAGAAALPVSDRGKLPAVQFWGTVEAMELSGSAEC